MFRLLISIVFMLLFLGCSNHAPLPTVKKVDLNRYLGTWYETARYDHSFEQGCTDVTATYALKENGDIKVTNRCIDEDGNIDIANGSAYAVNEDNNKLKVTFFWPFYGDYWILMLDKEYRYAVVGSPSREYLWILSRTKTLPNNTIKTILEKVKKLGFKSEPLIWTKHKQ